MQNISNEELNKLISDNLASIESVNNIIANTLHDQDCKLKNISNTTNNINDSLNYIYMKLYNMSANIVYFFNINARNRVK